MVKVDFFYKVREKENLRNWTEMFVKFPMKKRNFVYNLNRNII